MNKVEEITETGCYLDNHRGHYIIRDVIWLAEGYNYIIDGMEKFTLDMYEDHCNDENYPFEELVSLCDAAIEWLNSGQNACMECCEGSHRADWIGPGHVWETRENKLGVVIGGSWVICRSCSGSGRGPRIDGQNFPPRIPEGTAWDFNDGDFGLYEIEED